MISTKMLANLGFSVIVVSIIRGILEVIKDFTKKRRTRIIATIACNIILPIYFFLVFTYIIQLPEIISGTLAATLGVIFIK